MKHHKMAIRNWSVHTSDPGGWTSLPTSHFSFDLRASLNPVGTLPCLFYLYYSLLLQAPCIGHQVLVSADSDSDSDRGHIQLNLLHSEVACRAALAHPVTTTLAQVLDLFCLLCHCSPSFVVLYRFVYLCLHLQAVPDLNLRCEVTTQKRPGA
jgi:hypothetical protein